MGWSAIKFILQNIDEQHNKIVRIISVKEIDREMNVQLSELKDTLSKYNDFEKRKCSNYDLLPKKELKNDSKARSSRLSA